MKKFLSILLTIVVCLSISTTAFASNTSEGSDDELTLSEAATLLGVDEEELEGLEVHRLSSLSMNGDMRSIPTDVPPGVYYEDIDADTFTGAMHYLQGSKFKWVAQMRKVEATYPPTVGIRLVYADSSKPINFTRTMNSEGDILDSGWIDINYNEGIYFQYYFSGEPSDTIIVRMIVAVV